MCSLGRSTQTNAQPRPFSEPLKTDLRCHTHVPLPHALKPTCGVRLGLSSTVPGVGGTASTWTHHPMSLFLIDPDPLAVWCPVCAVVCVLAVMWRKSGSDGSRSIRGYSTGRLHRFRQWHPLARGGLLSPGRRVARGPWRESLNPPLPPTHTFLFVESEGGRLRSDNWIVNRTISGLHVCSCTDCVLRC